MATRFTLECNAEKYSAVLYDGETIIYRRAWKLIESGAIGIKEMKIGEDSDLPKELYEAFDVAEGYYMAKALRRQNEDECE